MAEIPCGHPACSCSVIPARLFCSDSCRRAADLPPEAMHGCSCRHAQCLGDAGRRRAVEEGVFAAAEPSGRRSDASEARANRPEP